MQIEARAGAVSGCNIDNSLSSNVSERHRGTVVVQKGTSHYRATVKHPELLTGLSYSAIGAWIVRWSQSCQSGQEDVKAAFEFCSAIVGGQDWREAT